VKVGKILGHANTGLYELFLENEHEAGLLNSAIGINLLALISDSVCAFSFEKRWGFYFFTSAQK